MGFAGLGPGKVAAIKGLCARADGGPDFMAYMLGDLGFFLLAARPEGGAGNGERLAITGEIHLGNPLPLERLKDFAKAAIRRATLILRWK